MDPMVLVDVGILCQAVDRWKQREVVVMEHLVQVVIKGNRR